MHSIHTQFSPFLHISSILLACKILFRFVAYKPNNARRHSTVTWLRYFLAGYHRSWRATGNTNSSSLIRYRASNNDFAWCRVTSRDVAHAAASTGKSPDSALISNDLMHRTSPGTYVWTAVVVWASELCDTNWDEPIRNISRLRDEPIRNISWAEGWTYQG